MRCDALRCDSIRLKGQKSVSEEKCTKEAEKERRRRRKKEYDVGNVGTVFVCPIIYLIFGIFKSDTRKYCDENEAK